MVNTRFLVLACIAIMLVQAQDDDKKKGPGSTKPGTAEPAEVTKVRSLNKQCVDRGFAGVCSISTKNPEAKDRCKKKLECAVRDKSKNAIYSQTDIPVPDGTTCGHKKICLKKSCRSTNKTLPIVIGEKAPLECSQKVPKDKKFKPFPLNPPTLS